MLNHWGLRGIGGLEVADKRYLGLMSIAPRCGMKSSTRECKTWDLPDVLVQASMASASWKNDESNKIMRLSGGKKTEKGPQ